MSLFEVLRERVQLDPFNAVATAVFFLAVLHTFAAASVTRLARTLQHRADERARRTAKTPQPAIHAELLHFLGEVEVVFGLWAVVLFVLMLSYRGWVDATRYFNETVNYTEPVFVVVIMALASSRPIVNLAESALRVVARLGGGT